MKKDLVDFIVSSPYRAMSGAAKAFRKISKEYIKICRLEIHEAQLDPTEVNPELLIRKRLLIKKIIQYKNILSTKEERRNARLTSKYLEMKRLRFQEKINKF